MIPVKIEHQVEQNYPDFLRDESRRAGHADTIAFPHSEEEIVALLKETSGPITVQGARTGITGGAVPDAGIILNMSQMTAVKGIRATSIPDTPYALTLQPGLTLKTLRASLQAKDFVTDEWSDDSIQCLARLRKDDRGFFFPPDPTEDTASIGGMLACNASGARSYKYGSTRNYVNAIRVVTAQGLSLTLTRGCERSMARNFSIVSSGEDITGALPSYDPPDVKNAAGYFAKDDMDLIDLFVGAEGTLGIVTEIEILLRPSPNVNWAVMCFMPDAESAERYVTACRNMTTDAVAAIEFFDDMSISLLREQKRSNPAFAHLPEIREDWCNCVFVELDGKTEEIVESAAMQIAELIEECGGSESATWMATGSGEMQRMKEFRHALPEAVNLTIDNRRKSEPTLTKLGTDFAVPAGHCHAMLSMYKKDLAAAKLDYVIFGHIGNDHLHVNILPTSREEYDKGRELYLHWAKKAIEAGGTVSAEHGIGKLKTAFLEEMYGTQGVDEMRRLKSVFDPESRVNPGNLFEVL